MTARLPEDFYSRPVLDVAAALLNKVLVADRGTARERSGRIVEVEAYGGPDDPGSHGWRGITPRTTVMFGPPGHWYAYLSYGVHWCANVVCETEGRCAAVLLRAVEPLTGLEEIRSARGPNVSDRHLADGPGKLGQAFGVDGTLYGANIADSRLIITDDGTPPPAHPESSARIGLSEGRGENLPWRFTPPSR